jgi:hypothetical protein
MSFADRPSVEKLRDKLARLTGEHIDSGKKSSECGSFTNRMELRPKPDYSASGGLAVLGAADDGKA